jgi:hypothetical protein
MDDPKEAGNPQHLNWVERRAQGQRLLHARAPEMWNRIRGAIQDACESFNRIYAPKKVSCDLENGQRVRIHRTLPPVNSFEQPEQIEAVVIFAKADHAVSVTFQSGSKTFFMDTDSEMVFIGADRAAETKKLTPDEISQVILEPILFPKS